MNKRQYIFIGLMIILFYLSFKILQFEYKKYTISGYMSQQKEMINIIGEYLEKGEKEFEHVKTHAYQNKILKSENTVKMKGEEVVILTPEKIYKKFSGKTIIKNSNKIKEKKYNITSGMTNFEKWIYFIFNKNIK